MKKEVDQFLLAQACRGVIRSKLPDVDLMKMRWVLTWKDDPNEADGKKAKARLVLLRYIDKDLETLRTESPTPSRRSRMMMYQMAANRGWRSWLADASSAFLQGEATEEERELYALPIPQLRDALGLSEEGVVQVLKACYGLTNAPRRWYEKVKKDQESRGWYACKLEPCLSLSWTH